MRRSTTGRPWPRRVSSPSPSTTASDPSGSWPIRRWPPSLHTRCRATTVSWTRSPRSNGFAITSAPLAVTRTTSRSLVSLPDRGASAISQRRQWPQVSSTRPSGTRAAVSQANVRTSLRRLTDSSRPTTEGWRQRPTSVSTPAWGPKMRPQPYAPSPPRTSSPPAPGSVPWSTDGYSPNRPAPSSRPVNTRRCR